MIQRIQSIYLLFAFVILITCFAPFCDFVTSKGSYQDSLFKDAEFNLFDTSFLSFTLMFISCLTFFNIFLFKNRKMQVNLCLTLVIITILFILSIIYLFKNAYMLNGVPIGNYKLSIGSILPFTSLFLTWVARKKILKDDKIVKSMDRLR